MPDPFSTEAIAERLRAGFAAGSGEGELVIDGLLRDEGCETIYVPALPTDGLVSREEHRIFRGVYDLLQSFGMEDVTVQVDGDTIYLTFTVLGTPPGGELIRVPNRMIFTINDGYLVRMECHVEPSPLRDMLVAELTRQASPG